MSKFFPVVLSGLLAVSFSQLAAAQSTTAQGSGGANVGVDVNAKSGTSATGGASIGSSAAAGGTSTKAGPTDNPNVTMDAQGREHANKGKHKGQLKNKRKNKDSSTSSAAGGSSASTQSNTDLNATSGTPKK